MIHSRMPGLGDNAFGLASNHSSSVAYFRRACRNAETTSFCRNLVCRLREHGNVIMRRPLSTPAKKREYQWAICLIRQRDKFLVGYVGAQDTDSAIEEAIKRFGITDPEQQKRLIAQRSG
jgi:hypothetical protein